MKVIKTNRCSTIRFRSLLVMTAVLVTSPVCSTPGSSFLKDRLEYQHNARRVESNDVAMTTSAAAAGATAVTYNEEEDNISMAFPPTTSLSHAGRVMADRHMDGRNAGAYRNTTLPVRLPRGKPSSLLDRVAGGIGFSKQDSAKRNIIRSSDSQVVIARMTFLKKEMCKSKPLEQFIKERGCIRRRVANRFCYGQCNSFFIPKVIQRSTPEKGARRQHHRHHHHHQQQQQQRGRPAAALPPASSGSSSSSPSSSSSSSSSRGGGGGGGSRRGGSGAGGRQPNRKRKLDDESLGSYAFRSCSFCQPKEIELSDVILQCPNSDPPTRRKRIPVVKQCACVALSFDNNS